MGGVGMICILLGFACAIWSVTLFCLGYKMSNNLIPPLLTIFFFIIGMLMFVFGLMSEMLMKIYYGVKVDVPYNIREVVENTEEKTA
jgi:hypothetical protein